MYEELVKRLRESADWADHFAVLMGRAEDVSSPIKREAADAIEELSDIARTMATIIENEKDMRVVAQAPHWIPVAERLPSENNRYLTVSIEPWFGAKVVDIMRWSGVWMYDGRQTGATVTHWMPLPEPPKEETQDE